MDWLRKQKTVLLWTALVVVAALIAILPSGDGDTPNSEDRNEEARSVTTSVPEVPTLGSSAPPSTLGQDPIDDRPDVPPIDCQLLLTSEERVEALAVRDRPQGDRSSFLIAQGETCGETLASDLAYYVLIEPGDPEDLVPGATIFGVEGQEAPGLADRALWFGGTDPGTGEAAGTLSVAHETAVGNLFFRIRLGRPDLDSTAQLEIAKDLAASALPRFPGVEVIAEQPQIVTFEPDPFDPSAFTYVGNLMVKEEAGEWTRGEGLVATLRMLVGELEPSEVLRHDDLEVPTDDGVVPLAQEYLESGSDADSVAEIERVLGLMFFSSEELAILSEREPGVTAELSLMSLEPLALQEDHPHQEYCSEVYKVAAPCLVESIPVSDGLYDTTYRLYRPHYELADVWQPFHIDWAGEAIRRAAGVVEPLGTMPNRVEVTFTEQVFTDDEGFRLSAASKVESEICKVSITESMATMPRPEFQQIVAAHIARCLAESNFPAVAKSWRRALALYLSSVAFSLANLEHAYSPMLASEEQSTGLPNRALTNWLWFEYLHPFHGGESGIVDIFRGLNGNLSSLDILDFYVSLSDADIPDLGKGLVPYEPKAWGRAITGPTVLHFSPPPFGISRTHAKVAAGKFACAEYSREGPVLDAWRPGGPGKTGAPGDSEAWDQLPSVFDGESLFVVTGTGPVTLTMTVKKLVDDRDDCDEEPTDPNQPTDPCFLPCGPSDYIRSATNPITRNIQIEGGG